MVDGERRRHSRLCLPKSGAGRLLPVTGEEGGKDILLEGHFQNRDCFGQPCSDKGSLHGELFSISTKQ